MRLVLVVASIVLAIIAAIIGFGAWDDQADHVVGWLALSLGCLGASFIAPPP